jgi:hypothetical protein
MDGFSAHQRRGTQEGGTNCTQAGWALARTGTRRAGGYASPADFSDGFVAAISVSAGLSVAAALFGAALPGRQSPLQAEPRTESSVVRSSSA